MDYNGYDIDHEVPGWETSARRHYGQKADNYVKLAFSLERRAKRAGRGSKEYSRYVRLWATVEEYRRLADLSD